MGGYEFGLYCSKEWTDSLNEMLAHPLVNICSDTESIEKVLAQVAHETAFYSTVFQPRDGGAGLIHMIPQNWQVNAQDMDALWPGNGYASAAATLGHQFFQSPQFGWRSVAMVQANQSRHPWLLSGSVQSAVCGADAVHPEKGERPQF